jgi:hypothetical protein
VLALEVVLKLGASTQIPLWNAVCRDRRNDPFVTGEYDAAALEICMRLKRRYLRTDSP